MWKKLVTLGVVLGLAACSSTPKVAKVEPPPPPKPVVKRIAILPPPPVEVYDMYNSQGGMILLPLVAAANSARNKDRQAALTTAMRARPTVALPQELTDAVAQRLRARGYEIEVVAGVARPAHKPDDIDYAKVVHASDAILLLSFIDVGLKSPNTDTRYLPRINVHGALYVPGRDTDLYDEKLYYGVEARKGKTWAIESADDQTFPDYDAVLGHLDKVEAVFHTGVSLISDRLVEQVDAALH